MASGTINGITSNQYIDARVQWSSTTDESTNTSTVTAALYYKRNNEGYSTTGTGTFYITINGTRISDTKTLTIVQSAWVKAIESTVTVSHNSDGAKEIVIHATGYIPGTTLESTAVTGNAVLDTIPRASTIDSLSCATSYFNGKMTYKYTPKSAALYNRCIIALNLDGEYTQVKDIKLGQKSASQQTATVTLTASELTTIYNKLPSDTKGKLRFTFRTYSDSGYSTQIGDPGYKEITLYVPDIDATKPFATMTLTPVNSLASPFNTMYIKGKTKIDVNITGVAGMYNATAAIHSVVIDGKNYGSPYTSEFITKDGEITVTGTIKDSRGFSRTYTQKVTFLSYANPRIIPASGEDSVVCARCDASGNLSESGTYLKIKAKRSYSSLESKNTCYIRYRYKPEGGSYSAWTTILATGATSDEVTTGALLGGNLLATTSYVVQVGVIDALGETDNTTISIPTDKVYMHRAGSMNSLGIGKYAEDENTIDIAEDITAKFRGKVQFAGEAWVNLGLAEGVAESESNFGRWGGTGCFYRACAGEKHIYVAFNCAFTFSGSAVQVNAEPIPEAYRPDRNVYTMCATGGRSVARILVNKSGNILVDWIQVIASVEQTASATVKWIDGYIDYWT